MTDKARKPTELSVRWSAGEIALLDRAAETRGQSRQDFVRSAAVRAAEDVILETTLIRMSPEGFALFVDATSGPGEPVAEIVKVLRRRPPW